MDTTKLIAEVLEDLEEEKREIEQRIALVNSIDWTKPVTEDEWHELCETSIRTSPLLAVLVKNIFPNAEEIKIGSNFVNFKLYGYSVQIPNSRCRGIYIATEDWYKDITYQREHRSDMHRGVMLNLKDYFDAVDNHLGWKKQAKARIAKRAYRNDLELFIKWFSYYRWKKVDRKKFEELWEKEEREYNEYTQKLERIDRENKENLNRVLTVLVPELDKFSADRFSYYDGHYHLTLKDVMVKEGLV